MQASPTLVQLLQWVDQELAPVHLITPPQQVKWIVENLREVLRLRREADLHSCPLLAASPQPSTMQPAESPLHECKLSAALISESCPGKIAIVVPEFDLGEAALVYPPS